MVSPAAKAKVEDLVKDAIREAMEKKKSSMVPVSKLLTEILLKEKIIDEPPLNPVLKGIPVPKEEVVPTPVKVVLKEEQKWFSDVLGITGIRDDIPISCFHSFPWHSSVASFVPDVDFSYHIDRKMARNILMAWELGEKVLCYGPTGTGKSSLIEQLCARTGRPFIRINCTGDMDSSMIFGQLLAKEGSTFWVDGAVTEAVRHGAVFAWDEWDVTPPEISMGLQWLLEDNGKLFLKDMPGTAQDKMIIPHSHFRLVAIGNTQGQGDETGAHAGTNVQNSATLDRFGTTVFIDYLDPAAEELMLLGKCGKIINAIAAKELIKLANLIRTAYQAGQLNLTMSPRTLLNICNKLNMNVALRDAFSLVYLNKLNPTQKKVADELFTKIYGKGAT
jgi:cobaltochelatase CobS